MPSFRPSSSSDPRPSTRLTSGRFGGEVAGSHSCVPLRARNRFAGSAAVNGRRTWSVRFGEQHGLVTITSVDGALCTSSTSAALGLSHAPGPAQSAGSTNAAAATSALSARSVFTDTSFGSPSWRSMTTVMGFPYTPASNVSSHSSTATSPARVTFSSRSRRIGSSEVSVGLRLPAPRDARPSRVSAASSARAGKRARIARLRVLGTAETRSRGAGEARAAPRPGRGVSSTQRRCKSAVGDFKSRVTTATRRKPPRVPPTRLPRRLRTLASVRARVRTPAPSASGYWRGARDRNGRRPRQKPGTFRTIKKARRDVMMAPEFRGSYPPRREARRRRSERPKRTFPYDTWLILHHRYKDTLLKRRLPVSAPRRTSLPPSKSRSARSANGRRGKPFPLTRRTWRRATPEAPSGCSWGRARSARASWSSWRAPWSCRGAWRRS